MEYSLLVSPPPSSRPPPLHPSFPSPSPPPPMTHGAAPLEITFHFVTAQFHQEQKTLPDVDVIFAGKNASELTRSAGGANTAEGQRLRAFVDDGGVRERGGITFITESPQHVNFTK